MAETNMGLALAEAELAFAAREVPRPGRRGEPVLCQGAAMEERTDQ